ncbi:MAG: VCBS repeat-containing protein [Planctomycetes bacterium]|nr:VCBS repeat-containing protein [Planctomycetota bacterium]
MATGDLNSDGNPDAITGNAQTGDLSLFFGVGNGNFPTYVGVSTGYGAGYLGLVDLDGNGSLDVATAAPGFPYVAIMSGSGTGTFSYKINRAVSGAIAGMNVGDLDSNGRPDLVIPNKSIGTATVLLNNGNMTFAPNMDYFVGEYATLSAIADVDNDLSPDLIVVSYYQGCFRILFNHGDGTFPKTIQFTLPSGANTIVTRDFNSDGKLDFAASHDVGKSVSVMLSTASAYGFPKTYPAANYSKYLMSADFNGDGRLDLAAFTEYGLISIFLASAPPGNFGHATNYYTPAYASSLVAGDLNNDGFLDLVASSYSPGKVSTLLGNGAGAFGNLKTITANATSVMVGDFNSDGKLDVVGVAGTNNLLAGDGLGNLTLVSYIPSNFGPQVGSLADLDGDGILDVVAGCWGGGVSVFMGNGVSGFGPETNYANPPYVTSVSVGDLNGDGIPDVAAASSSFITNVYLGIGAGALSHFADFSAYGDYGFAGSASTITIADFDADGRADFVAGASNLAAPGYIAILQNQLPKSGGTVSFGTGTPGCEGVLALAGNSAPAVGNVNFGIAVSNAPSNSLGVLIVANKAVASGYDPLGIGLVFLVDLIASTEILAFDAPSDPGGMGYAAASIPNNPALSGSVYYAQAFFAEQPGYKSSKSTQPLVSSKGLTIYIQ